MEITRDSYTKTYKLRTTGQRARTVEVSVPRDVIIRQSKRAGLTVEEYCEQYRAVAHFGDSEEIHYHFEKFKG